MNPLSIAVVIVCLVLGGVIKGATDAGVAIFAVPAIATLYDLRVAVVLMLVSNLSSNLWQAWNHRRDVALVPYVLRFLVAGAVGVVVGSVALAMGAALVNAPPRPLR